MSTERNETDITMSLSKRFVVGTNDAKTGVLASSSRIGLKRCSSEAGYLAKITFQFLQKLQLNILLDK
jgi:hypothetical protein